MKKFSVKTVVAIGIGAALFFVLGKIAIPSFVANTNISLQYAILAMFATLFGPIAGALIGFIGHTLIDHCIRSGRCDHLSYDHEA